MSKYRPSNGSEGMWFMGLFCDRCAHNDYQDDGSGKSCEIFCNTMVYDVEDTEYPEEWQETHGSMPTCTKFEKEATP